MRKTILFSYILIICATSFNLFAKKPDENIKKLRISCFFYEPNNDGVDQGFWLWAQGAKKEYVYVAGAMKDSFFEIKKVFGYQKKHNIAYEKSFDTLKKLCENSLINTFPNTSYPNKKLIHIIGKTTAHPYVKKELIFDNDKYNNGQKITRMVVFGDSLSDDGNLLGNLKVFPPRENYFHGRFCDGPVWVDYLRQYFNLSILNLAVSGAISQRRVFDEIRNNDLTTIIRNSVQPALTSSLKKEIEKYKNNLNEGSISNKESTLFVIWAGGNDYLARFSSVRDANKLLDQPSNPDGGYMSIAEQTIENIMESIKKLSEVGAQNFIIFNLPDLGSVPWIKYETIYHKNDHEDPNKRLVNFSTRLTELSRFHNIKLKEALDTYLSYNEVLNINLIDVFEYSDKLVKVLGNDNTEFLEKISYKDTNISIGKLCLNSTDSCENKVERSPKSAFFWDAMHPTSLVHNLFAKKVKGIIEKDFSK